MSRAQNVRNYYIYIIDTHHCCYHSHPINIFHLHHVIEILNDIRTTVVPTYIYNKLHLYQSERLSSFFFYIAALMFIPPNTLNVAQKNFIYRREKWLFFYTFLYALLSWMSSLYISHDDCCHNAQNKLNSRQSFRFIQNLKTFFSYVKWGKNTNK